MPCTRKFIRKVIKNYPNIEYAKRYDYVAKIKENNWIIFRREYEGKPWEKILKIPIGNEDSNIFEDWRSYEAHTISKFKEDPKHGNRYFVVN